MIERAYIKFSNGDRLSDEELLALHWFFRRAADIGLECPTFFGAAVVGEACRKAVQIDQLLKARKGAKA